MLLSILYLAWVFLPRVCSGHLPGTTASLCLDGGHSFLLKLQTFWSIHCLTRHPGAQARVLPVFQPVIILSRVVTPSPHPFPLHGLPSGTDVSSSLLIGPPAAVPAHLHSITQLECSFHSEHQIMPAPCLKHFNKFSLF